MVAGTPTGTPNAAVSTEIELDAQSRPAVDIDRAPASRPAAMARPAERSNEAARAAVCAASTTVVLANQSRPPAMIMPSIKIRTGITTASSAATAPRSSRFADVRLIMAG